MSVKEFNFEDWFKFLVLGEDIHDKPERCYLELVANDELDLSSYYNAYILVVNNLGFISKDENDKYYVEVVLPRNDNDISTGFVAYPFYGSENSSSDVRISLNVGGKILPINGGTKIINVCAMYTELKIRLTFENDPFDIRVKYLSHLLQSDLREKLMQKRFIQDGILYSEGVARNI